MKMLRWGDTAPSAELPHLPDSSPLQLVATILKRKIHRRLDRINLVTLRSVLHHDMQLSCK
jgi:hypothetical protein